MWFLCFTLICRITYILITGLTLLRATCKGAIYDQPARGYEVVPYQHVRVWASRGPSFFGKDSSVQGLRTLFLVPSASPS